MHADRELTRRRGCTVRFQTTGPTICLARTININLTLCIDVLVGQQFVRRTLIGVLFRHVGKLLLPKSTGLMTAVDHRDMQFDGLLLEPGEKLTRPVGLVGTETLWLESNFCLACRSMCLAAATSWLKRAGVATCHTQLK